jgi:hypothetical protein
MAKKKYKYSLPHYAAIYGVAVSTIAAYSRKNYPLDDEEATRARITAQKYQPQGKLAVDQDASTPENASQTPVKPRVGSLGLVASIQRLKEAEQEAAAEYEAALKPDIKAAKQKQWLALVEQLRKVEQSSPDIQEANKKSINVDELEQSLSKTFNVFRQELENLPRRMEQELVGKDVLGIREALTKEVECIISTLYKCKWLKGNNE